MAAESVKRSIGLHVYFMDCFFFLEITTPKFTVKFDLKLGGKNRTENNLRD